MKYHGWLVVEKREGFLDRIYAEFKDENGERQRKFFSNVTEVIEFWDDKVQEHVKLLPTLLGAYRVYTGEWHEPNNA
jgi:hypothetical protein